MILRTLGAFFLALLVSAGFGKIYVPWLKKKNATQPLKEEVAKIYAEKTDGSEEEDSTPSEGGEQHG